MVSVISFFLSLISSSFHTKHSSSSYLLCFKGFSNAYSYSFIFTIGVRIHEPLLLQKETTEHFLELCATVNLVFCVIWKPPFAPQFPPIYHARYSAVFCSHHVTYDPNNSQSQPCTFVCGNHGKVMRHGKVMMLWE
jgi:hypothetical protein